MNVLIEKGRKLFGKFNRTIQIVLWNNSLVYYFRKRRLRALYSAGLPIEFHEGINFLVSGLIDEETLKLADRIEQIRGSIYAQGDKKVPIWYSPKPGSSGDLVTSNIRPKPGKTLEFTMKQIAETGKDRRIGIFLYLVAKAFRAKTVLELGSCAGISGCYLSAPDCVETFITVEGSTPLSRIAEVNIHNISPNARIVNSTFDEAIDQELPKMNTKIDYAFIDGHHEKIATIHYYERIIPYLNNVSVVIFDDISWSYDMRDAWNELVSRREFIHTLNLGSMGACVFEKSRTNCKLRKKWDLQPVLGKARIGDPHGWKK
ncbi:MAG: O-methyltransferase [Thermodesulfobacteriota bacterium]